MRNLGKLQDALVVLAIICTAAVLRSPITSMGALSVSVQGSLGLSAGVMGMLTTLPLLAFAASALFMGAIGNRFGKSLVLAVGSALVVIGILARSYMGVVGLIGGTVLMGLGISAGNVLIPAVVRECFPLSIGTLTAIYTTVMPVFAGGASGLGSALVDGGMPWQNVLALLAPFAVAAAIVWGFLCMRERRADDEPKGRFVADAVAVKRQRGFSVSSLLPARIVKSPVTWWIALQFALQSILFYCLVAWTPSMLSDRGISGDSIGLCVTLIPVMGIACTVAVPQLAQRMRRQRLLGAAFGALTMVSLILFGVASSDAIAVLAVALAGLALGAPFSLCMFYFGARVANSDDSARLSSIAQTFGYLLAAIGPACMGFMYDVSGSWDGARILFVVLAFGLIISGWKAGSGSIPEE